MAARDPQQLEVRSAQLPDPEMVHTLYNIARMEFSSTCTTGNEKTGIRTMMARLTHGKVPEDLSKLVPITLQEACKAVNYIHSGRILFGKIVAPAFHSAGTNIIFEDLNGHQITATLFNYVLPRENPEVSLPMGSHIAFIEPMLKFPRDDPRHDPCIRCDNPEAVRVFATIDYFTQFASQYPQLGMDCPHPCLATATDFRRATEALAGGTDSYHVATQIFDALGEPKDTKALLARAEFHVANENFSAALVDARNAKAQDPDSALAFFYEALALLYLERPSEALQVVKKITNDNAEFPQSLTSLCSEIERAVLEQTEGEYDWNLIRSELASSRRLTGIAKVSRRHCDFVSPKIEVVGPGKNISDTGRGVVANEDLKAGTVLVIEKAISFTDDGGVYCEMYDCDEEKLINWGSGATALPVTARAIQRNPDLAKKLYALTAGQEYETSSGQSCSTNVDILRISKTIQKNSFGSNNWEPVGEPLGLIVASERWRETHSYLGDQLESVMKTTKYWAPDIPQKHEGEEDVQNVTGVWYFSSFFNHSCFPNTCHRSIGDLKILFLNSDVKKGEELCISYINQSYTREMREECLAKWAGGGFTCKCKKCELELKNPQYENVTMKAKMVAVRYEAMSFNYPAQHLLDRIAPEHERASLRSKMLKMPLQVCYPALAKLLAAEGAACLSNRQFQKALECFKEVDEYHKYDIWGNCEWLENKVRGICALKQLGSSEQVMKDALVKFCEALDEMKTIRFPCSAIDAVLLFRFYWPKSCGNLKEVEQQLLQVAHHTQFFPAESGEYCAQCMVATPGLVLKKCSRCKTVCYCSREHQKKHWKLHKRVCTPSN